MAFCIHIVQPERVADQALVRLARRLRSSLILVVTALVAFVLLDQALSGGPFGTVLITDAISGPLSDDSMLRSTLTAGAVGGDLPTSR